MQDTDTVTRAELAGYYNRHTFVGKGPDYGDNIAAHVFLDVGTHREPEYVDGAVYMDAYREVWLFRRGGLPSGQWLSFTDDPVGFDVPKRPLTRMVPENGDMLCYLGHAITRP